MSLSVSWDKESRLPSEKFPAEYLKTDEPQLLKRGGKSFMCADRPPAESSACSRHLIFTAATDISPSEKSVFGLYNNQEFLKCRINSWQRFLHVCRYCRDERSALTGITVTFGEFLMKPGRLNPECLCDPPSVMLLDTHSIMKGKVRFRLFSSTSHLCLK